MSEFTYTVDRGDGRWLLMSEGRVIRSTPADELAISYDTQGWFLLKHGTPDMVRRHAQKVRDALQGTPLEGSIQVLVGKSPPLLGERKAGNVYFEIEDVNRCISTTGFIERLVAKTSAIDVQAIDVEDERSAAPRERT